jgi:RecA-family ATPase
MSSPNPLERCAGVQALSELATQPVAWLWPARLALGKLAVLDGDPDQGKSLVALDLCARLSTGRPMPDGSPGPGPAASLILQDEDTADDTLLPRLKSLGAELKRVSVWRGRDGQDEVMRFPRDLGLLEEALIKTGARLVVLDPVMAFLDQGIIANSDQSVRRALSPLARLAAQLGVAVLLVRHLNKFRGQGPLYRCGGSIGLLAACRSA